MAKPHWVTSLLTVSVIVASSSLVFSQDFPNKTIRIVTGGAGGGNDIVARLIAKGLTEKWGQQVIVENRASGIIPGEVVSRADPDGYTMVLSGRSFWTSPLLVAGKKPYDPVTDFSPITIPVATPNILAVHPSLPVKSVKDLIALAKARPGDLNYAFGGIGSSTHLAAELFISMAGVDIVRINYRGAAPMYADVIAGQVQLVFGTATSFAPYAISGKLRGLAVTSAKPSALAPGLPTIEASGLPGYEFTSPFVIMAPRNTPAPIITALNNQIVLVLNTREVKDLLSTSRIGEIVGSTPAQVTAMIKTDIEKLGKIIAANRGN